MGKPDFSRWQKLIPSHELKKLKKFVKGVRENPEKYVNVEDVEVAPSPIAKISNPYIKELEGKLHKNNGLTKKPIETRLTSTEENNLRMKETPRLEVTRESKRNVVITEDKPTLPPYLRKNPPVPNKPSTAFSIKQEPAKVMRVKGTFKHVNCNSI